MMMHLRIFLVAAVSGTAACGAPADRPAPETSPPSLPSGVLNAAFVGLDGVYNSELMAPYDILQHSVFRDSVNYIRPFIVSPDGQPFTSFEGITITPDYSFEDALPVDILVIPSTENSMSADLENPELMAWLRRAVEQAAHVISACDGAFPLAATGALDGRRATTFPADRDRFAAMFPSIDVVYDASYVVDDKFITSVGGALSYEPALHLLTSLYGLEHARQTAAGLVLDWDTDRGMVPNP